MSYLISDVEYNENYRLLNDYRYRDISVMEAVLKNEIAFQIWINVELCRGIVSNDYKRLLELLLHWRKGMIWFKSGIPVLHRLMVTKALKKKFIVSRQIFNLIISHWLVKYLLDNTDYLDKDGYTAIERCEYNWQKERIRVYSIVNI